MEKSKTPKLIKFIKIEKGAKSQQNRKNNKNMYVHATTTMVATTIATTLKVGEVQRNFS